MTNWAEYDTSLRQRGSMTIWFSEEAIESWRAAPRTTPGGQPNYSDLAITTALTVRTVFRQGLRQKACCMKVILAMMPPVLSLAQAI